MFGSFRLFWLPASSVTPAFRTIFTLSKDYLTVGGGGGVTRSAMQWNSLGKNTVPGSLPGSARAQVFQQVAQRPRTFKYGTCDKHGLALKPWVFLSGRNKGRCGALCSEFWSRDERDKPACWTMNVFSDDRIHDFPTKPPGALFWLEGSPESRRCCTLTCGYVTLAKRKGCPLTQVKHCRMQFCRRLNKVLRGQEATHFVKELERHGCRERGAPCHILLGLFLEVFAWAQVCLYL